MTIQPQVIDPVIEQPMVSASRDYLESLYLADRRPWVVAFSGGKDSTAVLQLVFQLLIHLGPRAQKPVIVLASDTQVEAPNVAEFVASVLHRLGHAAAAQNFPLTTLLVRPEPNESFWGKLIGRGYPPPSRWFRWCTSNMKIKPSRRAIEDITRVHGSVILLLGTRTSESPERGKNMQARETNSRGLNPHHEIPNALVATPIADWSTEDVWEYLSASPCPWGADHAFLFSLYRQASGGECPVIFDLHTPSCGGSRFGCWTCTVVREDKSLQGFIRSGKQELQPLIDFRDWLITLRDKPGYRSGTRRNGLLGPGAFLPFARQEILDALLRLEQQVRLPLVSDAELAYIQFEWSREFDFQSHLAYSLAARYGREISAMESDWSHPEDDLVEKAAVESGVAPDLLKTLLDLRRRDYPSLDRWGAKAKFEQAIGDLVSKAAHQAERAAQR